MYDLGLPLPGPAGRRVWLKPDATCGGRFQVDPDGFPPNIGWRAGVGPRLGPVAADEARAQCSQGKARAQLSAGKARAQCNARKESKRPSSRMSTFMANAQHAATHVRWHIIDADGQVLGRISTIAARLLQGKHKPAYTPFIDT